MRPTPELLKPSTWAVQFPCGPIIAEIRQINKQRPDPVSVSRRVLDNLEARNLPMAQVEQQIFKLQRRLENWIDAGMPLYQNAGAEVDDWVDLLLR